MTGDNQARGANPGVMDERTLVEYLLGRLAEPERSQTEERIFTEEGLDEELQATADDLIHAYLKGSLSPEDRGRFETHFLALPRHQQRLAFIRDLSSAVEQVVFEDTREKADPVRAAASPWQGLWPVAAALALLVGGVLFMLARPSGNERGATNALDSQATSPSPTAAVASTPTPNSALPEPETSKRPTVRVVRLPQDSNAPVRVTLSNNTRVVRVEVAVPQGPPSFDAILRAPDGTDAWRAESLAPPASGRHLVFNVPAEAFRGTNYTLRVEGEPLRDATPPVLEYRVRVVRER